MLITAICTTSNTVMTPTLRVSSPAEPLLRLKSSVQSPFTARQHTFIISIRAFRFCVTSAARFQLSGPPGATARPGRRRRVLDRLHRAAVPRAARAVPGAHAQPEPGDVPCAETLVRAAAKGDKMRCSLGAKFSLPSAPAPWYCPLAPGGLAPKERLLRRA